MHGLHSVFQDSQSYIERTCVKEKERAAEREGESVARKWREGRRKKKLIKERENENENHSLET